MLHIITGSHYWVSLYVQDQLAVVRQAGTKHTKNPSDLLCWIKRQYYIKEEYSTRTNRNDLGNENLPAGSGDRPESVFPHSGDHVHTCQSDGDRRDLLENRTEDMMVVWEADSWSRWCAGRDLHTHAFPLIQTCKSTPDWMKVTLEKMDWNFQININGSLISGSYLAEQISLRFDWQNFQVQSGWQVLVLRTSSTVWTKKRCRKTCT